MPSQCWLLLICRMAFPLWPFEPHTGGWHTVRAYYGTWANIGTWYRGYFIFFPDTRLSATTFCTQNYLKWCTKCKNFCMKQESSFGENSASGTALGQFIWKVLFSGPVYSISILKFSAWLGLSQMRNNAGQKNLFQRHEWCYRLDRFRPLSHSGFDTIWWWW